MKYDFYGVYSTCRNAAWQCQKDFDICRLPVKLKSAANRAGIRILRNSVLGELRGNESGAGIYHDGKWYIIYDDTLDSPQSRVIIAHELGHILLGHEYKYSDLRFEKSEKKLKCEREADMFAVRLLAPACVLHELGATTADEIARLCDIPRGIAAERARRMKLLEARGAFYKSPLERQVCDKFSDFIRENRNYQYSDGGIE